MDYIAPELIRGRPATAASDVYALGCVAYETLTGSPPFAGRSALRAAFAHLEEVPADPVERRPEIGRALGASVLLALAKLPEERPAPATAYADALRLSGS